MPSYWEWFCNWSSESLSLKNHKEEKRQSPVNVEPGTKTSGERYIAWQKEDEEEMHSASGDIWRMNTSFTDTLLEAPLKSEQKYIF